MQATMNLKIKFRESFRPFAPCVLQERVSDYFALRPDQESPYMLLVAPVLRETSRGALRGRPAEDGRGPGPAPARQRRPLHRARPSRTWITARACRRWTRSGTGGFTA